MDFGSSIELSQIVPFTREIDRSSFTFHSTFDFSSAREVINNEANTPSALIAQITKQRINSRSPPDFVTYLPLFAPADNGEFIVVRNPITKIGYCLFTNTRHADTLKCQISALQITREIINSVKTNRSIACHDLPAILFPPKENIQRSLRPSIDTRNRITNQLQSPRKSPRHRPAPRTTDASCMYRTFSRYRSAPFLPNCPGLLVNKIR